MDDRPLPARSELEVARIVWRLGRSTVRQVLDLLPEGRGLDFKTVQTYLRRLEAKGYLQSSQEGRTKVYSPRVQPRHVIGQVMDDVVERLFGGEVVPLFQHLIHDRGLSDDELRRLRELIDQLEGETK